MELLYLAHHWIAPELCSQTCTRLSLYVFLLHPKIPLPPSQSNKNSCKGPASVHYILAWVSCNAIESARQYFLEPPHLKPGFLCPGQERRPPSPPLPSSH